MAFTLAFEQVRPLFGGKMAQGQVDGCNTIVAAFETDGDGDVRHVAYLLATAYHETARTMQPIYERGTKAYFSKYEAGTKLGHALGNEFVGDGYLFRGRGYVQLTGRRNYRSAGKKLGLDLVKEPDKALIPEIAARILITGCLDGWFTGKRIDQYDDFKNMRRVINGTDRADLIATYAASFLKAL